MSAALVSNNNQPNIVNLSNGKPTTNSLAIAKEFGRRHDNVVQSLEKLIKGGSLSFLDFKERDYIDARGKQQRMIELSERGALIAMPFIGGEKSKQGQVKLVDAFLSIRDDLTINWDDSRKAASVSFRAVMDALKAARTEEKKETLACHYANESRMINSIVFGKACCVDRSSLSKRALSILERVEAKDAYLIAKGKTFSQRKAELFEFQTNLLVQVSLEARQ